MNEKIILYCPIKKCTYYLRIPKDTPEVPIVKYIFYATEFEKHLIAEHTISELTQAVFSYAISKLKEER